MDYTTVTEVPGNRVTREAVTMMSTRYTYAATLCQGKDVLEVGCGAGQGLGRLAEKAGRVVGGDYTEPLLRMARQHYGQRIPLVRLDAHRLPFSDRSFDVVILYEAIYYLAQPDLFLEECRRVLRPKGFVLICTVNKEWTDFNPSPFSIRYFSVRELSDLFKRHQFDVELLGGFPIRQNSLKDQAVSAIKRIAVALHIVPKTMRGKEFLKRIFFGKLVALPSEIEEGMAEYIPPVSLSGNGSGAQYKVIYAVAQVK
jgi:ubiquinone/menaquinone biosynthesis C-methylase UbiE